MRIPTPSTPTLIILGAGGESVHAITHAQSLGYRVLATDKNIQATGAPVADEFLPLSVYDPAETVAGLLAWRAQGGTPGGVLSVGVDAPHTVAAIGKALGIPTVSEETARLATDKLAMKERFHACGIPIPWFMPVRDVQDICEAVKLQGYPLVIKPVDSRGARGVLRLLPTVDLAWAYETARAESTTGRVMIEAYLDGPQISTEGLIVNGVGYLPGLADRNYEFLERFAPHIIENGGDLPSDLPLVAQKELQDLTTNAALALGLTHGPVKGDLVWHRGQPYVIELAARHSGGYFVTHEIPWNTGVDLLGASIHMAMGKLPTPRELLPQYQQGVCQRYFFPAPGTVHAIYGEEETAAIPGIRYLEVRVKVGDLVPPTVSHPSRPGVVMAVGESKEAARAAVHKALKTLKIETR